MIVLLNGCSSAGKTSIAIALQDMLASPFLRTGIDDAFRLIPARYHAAAEGFFFDRDARGLVRLNFGTVGRATMRAYLDSMEGLIRGGMNVIIDEVLIDDEMRRRWLALLTDRKSMMVGVHCELAEMERREVAREDRLVGQARGQIDIVHAGMRYDLEVDTTSRTPRESAATIARRLPNC